MLGTESKILEAYVKPGLMRFQFRHQLNYGKGSELASQTAECAGDQGKFFAMRELLFSNYKRTVTANPIELKALAQEMKLDSATFATCLDTEKYLAKVKAQDQARRAAGWARRPTFDINGIRVEGNVPIEILKDAIERALKQ